MTLGENLADNGGIDVAYQAFRQAWDGGQLSDGKQVDKYRLPGVDLSPEALFYVSFGRLWCKSVRPQYAAKLVSKEKGGKMKHALSFVRRLVVCSDPLPILDIYKRALSRSSTCERSAAEFARVLEGIQLSCWKFHEPGDQMSHLVVIVADRCNDANTKRIVHDEPFLVFEKLVSPHDLRPLGPLRSCNFLFFFPAYFSFQYVVWTQEGAFEGMRL